MLGHAYDGKRARLSPQQPAVGWPVLVPRLPALGRSRWERSFLTRMMAGKIFNNLALLSAFWQLVGWAVWPLDCCTDGCTYRLEWALVCAASSDHLADHQESPGSVCRDRIGFAVPCSGTPTMACGRGCHRSSRSWLGSLALRLPALGRTPRSCLGRIGGSHIGRPHRQRPASRRSQVSSPHEPWWR